MRWLAGWVMLVRVVSRGHENGRKAEVENTARQESVAGLQRETMEVQAPTRGRLASAIATALYFLVHPRTRERDEADAESRGSRKPRRTPDASRSTMDAGITGGFSLLMNDPHARNRR
jgi:hypothetical protein